MKCSKALSNIILGRMEAIGSVRVKTFVGSGVPRNSALEYRNTPASHRFECIRVVKSSQKLPNIILGLMEAIGCVHAKTFVESSVPRNIALGYRNASVSHGFAGIRVGKCSKTHPNIFLGLMEAIWCVRAKTFRGNSVPKNSAFRYLNAPVSHRFAFIRAIGCVRVKTFVGSSVPKTVHSGNETHQFLILLYAFG